MLIIKKKPWNKVIFVFNDADTYKNAVETTCNCCRAIWQHRH